MLLYRLCLTALLAVSVGFLANCSSADDDDETNTLTLTGAGEGTTSLAANAPRAATLSIYQFAVSTSEYCTDPVTIFDNGSTPVEFDMFSGPELGSGDVDEGTFPCVIMVMAPAVIVTPDQDDGPCEAGTSFTQNVCGGGGESYTQDLTGTAATCGSSTDKAYLYLSTASTVTSDYETENCYGEGDDLRACNSWEPPTADNLDRGVPLGAALVVDGDESGVFTMSNLSVTSRSEEGEDPSCDMERPDFTFVAGS